MDTTLQDKPIAEHRGFRIYVNLNTGEFKAKNNPASSAEFSGANIHQLESKIEFYLSGHCQPRPTTTNLPGQEA